MSARRYTVPGIWGPKERRVSIALLPPEGQEIRMTGQIAWDEDENIVGPGDVAEQTRQCFRNIQRVLAHFGGELGDIVEMTTWYTRPEDVAKIHAVRREFLTQDTAPASTAIQVRGFAYPEFLVELTPVAVIPWDRFRDPDEEAQT